MLVPIPKPPHPTRGRPCNAYWTRFAELRIDQSNNTSSSSRPERYKDNLTDTTPGLPERHANYIVSLVGAQRDTSQRLDVDVL
jgi:hypothetical protein